MSSTFAEIGSWTLPCTVASSKENFIVLKPSKNEAQEILWPRSYAPEGAVEGMPVMLTLETEKKSAEEKYAVMRRLLEELIN